MNIKREWKREPMVRLTAESAALDSGYALDDLVSDFIRRRTDPASPLMKNRDDIVDFCARAVYFNEAAKRACASIRPNGKCHNHQSRVKVEDRAKLFVHMRHDRAAFCKLKTFEAVLEKVESYDVKGIGPVTCYDVATRVAAFLKVEPTGVHMHAGCLAGFKALQASTSKWSRRLAVSVGPSPRVGSVVPFGALPRPMRRLSADNVEDFLCVYREVLHEVVI